MNAQTLIEKYNMLASKHNTLLKAYQELKTQNTQQLEQVAALTEELKIYRRYRDEITYHHKKSKDYANQTFDMLKKFSASKYKTPEDAQRIRTRASRNGKNLKTFHKRTNHVFEEQNEKTEAQS